MKKILKLSLATCLTLGVMNANLFAKSEVVKPNLSVKSEIEKPNLFKQLKKLSINPKKIYDILPKDSVFHKNRKIIIVDRLLDLGDLYHVSGHFKKGDKEQPFELYVTPNGKQIHGGTVIMENGKPFSIPYDMMQHISKSAIKIGTEKDPNKQIFVFTDPDCPYCIRFGDSMIKKLVKKGYSINLFLFPLTGLHPKSKEKSLYLLSLPKEKRLEALKRIQGNNNKNNEWKVKDATLKDAKVKLKEQVEIGKAIKLTGTPFIVNEYGQRINPRKL